MPRANPWHKKVDIPDGYTINALACNPDTGSPYPYLAGVVAGGESTAAVIFKYDGATLKEIFRGPEDSAFYDVRWGNGEMWATGHRTENDEMKPYAVKSDGTLFEEVVVPAAVTAKTFTRVFPRPGGVVWLEGSDGVYVYDSGEWRLCPPTALVPNTGDHGTLTVTAGGTAYYLKSHETSRTMLISRDNGLSWLEEPIILEESIYRFDFTGELENLASGGETPYFCARLYVHYGKDVIEYNGVVARNDAPAGSGTYDVVFMAPKGPQFYGIDALAFFDERNGYAGGVTTGVVLKDGVWRLDDIPDNSYMAFRIITAGFSDYWAIVEASHVPGLWIAPYEGAHEQIAIDYRRPRGGHYVGLGPRSHARRRRLPLRRHGLLLPQLLLREGLPRRRNRPVGR